MSDPVFKDLPKVFLNCMTVKELKELIKDWPEVNPVTGEPCEVWLDDGKGLTNPVMTVWPLNRRGPHEDGRESADLLLGPKEE